MAKRAQRTQQTFVGNQVLIDASENSRDTNKKEQNFPGKSKGFGD